MTIQSRSKARCHTERTTRQQWGAQASPVTLGRIAQLKRTYGLTSAELLAHLVENELYFCRLGQAEGRAEELAAERDRLAVESFRASAWLKRNPAPREILDLAQHMQHRMA